jgi:hypothetical protein
MRSTWLGKSVKLIGALLASLLLNLSIDLYRNGRNNETDIWRVLTSQLLWGPTIVG